MIVSNALPVFAVIRRKTNTLSGLHNVANWSGRHGSPNDEEALVIAQISTGVGEEGEDRIR